MNVQDIVTLIAAVTALVTAIGSIVMNRQLIDQKFETINEKLDTHNEKLDEHNGYAKRFSEIEIAIVGIQKDIEYIRKQEESR